jgi:hypothetical protein
MQHYLQTIPIFSFLPLKRKAPPVNQEVNPTVLLIAPCKSMKSNLAQIVFVETGYIIMIVSAHLGE